MKKNTALFLLLIFILLTIFPACRKQSSHTSSNEYDALVTERFFALPANASPAIKAIAAQIKKQNDQVHFVPQLVAQNGYPLWGSVKASNDNNSVTRSANNDSVLYLIPFSASTSINAYLFCKQIADTFQLKLNNKQGLLNQLSVTDSLKNKRLIAKLKIMAWMEKNVYQKDSILFNHPLIGGIKNASVQFNAVSGNSGRQTGEFADITICGWQWNQPTGWVTGLAPGQAGNYGSWSYNCTSYTIWINGSNDEYLEENQTNNDGWWINTGGGLGEDADAQETYLAAAWDNNIITDSTLRPCFREVLDSIRKIQPGEIAKIIKVFSGTTPGFEWKLAEVNSLASDTTASATTHFSTTGQFAYTLFHKPTMPNATNLFHAAIIIHEAVHAFLISYYNNNTILSQAFKDSMLLQPYGKQFEEYARITTINNQSQHYLMAQMRTKIQESIFNYCKRVNIGINDTERQEIAYDMSWVGLQNTKIYEDEITPFSQDDYLIRGRWEAEKTNSIYYNSNLTPNTLSVKGIKTCN